MRILFVVFSVLFIFSACKEEVDQSAIDDGIIQDYLEEKNITATRHSSGLYYSIKKAGFGGHPNYYSTVEVTYKGYLIDGTVFDNTSPGTTAVFALSDLIPAWQIGIPLLQRGGSGTFYVPSELGYGSQASADIPANSVLIFDISLVDF